MTAFRFGIYLGFIWAATVFCLGLLAKRFPRLERFVLLASRMYFGFRSGLPGALIGSLWGFCDGFLSGSIIAMLFNLIKK